MATLSKKMLDFCKTAYGNLKDETSDHATYIQLRDSDNHYIEYIMQKRSWYSGSWSLFEGSSFVCNISEELLIELNKPKPVEPEKVAAV